MVVVGFLEDIHQTPFCFAFFGLIFGKGERNKRSAERCVSVFCGEFVVCVYL